MAIDPKVARDLAVRCMTLKIDDDSAHLGLNIALWLGWELRHDEDTDNGMYWAIPDRGGDMESMSVECELLPRFAEERGTVAILLEMLGDSYAYHVVKKGRNAWSATVEWNNKSVGADAYTETGALTAAVLLALAMKQEANVANV